MMTTWKFLQVVKSDEFYVPGSERHIAPVLSVFVRDGAVFFLA